MTLKYLAPTKKIHSFHPPQRTLLGPGPSEINPRVMAAMSLPAIGYLRHFLSTSMPCVSVSEISSALGPSALRPVGPSVYSLNMSAQRPSAVTKSGTSYSLRSSPFGMA